MKRYIDWANKGGHIRCFMLTVLPACLIIATMQVLITKALGW